MQLFLPFTLSQQWMWGWMSTLPTPGWSYQMTWRVWDEICVCACVLSWCGRFCMSGLSLCRFGAGINTSCCPTTRSGLTGSSACWAGRWCHLGDTTGRWDLLDIPLAWASTSDRTKTGCGFEQVDVTGKTDWDLGVARKSVSRKGKITVTPGNGYWFLSLRDKWVNHIFPKLNVYNFLETATVYILTSHSFLMCSRPFFSLQREVRLSHRPLLRRAPEPPAA